MAIGGLAIGGLAIAGMATDGTVGDGVSPLLQLLSALVITREVTTTASRGTDTSG